MKLKELKEYLNTIDDKYDEYDVSVVSFADDKSENTDYKNYEHTNFNLPGGINNVKWLNITTRGISAVDRLILDRGHAKQNENLILT